MSRKMFEVPVSAVAVIVVAWLALVGVLIYLLVI